MKGRKPISRKLREEVYEKYGGRCAYCGCEIEYKDMQIDHIVPFASSIYGTEDVRENTISMISNDTINSVDNLMPSCRQCNFYKGGLSIEGFRKRLKGELEHTCVNSFQSRLAIKYGILSFNGFNGEFFFEKKVSEEEKRIQQSE